MRSKLRLLWGVIPLTTSLIMLLPLIAGLFHTFVSALGWGSFGSLIDPELFGLAWDQPGWFRATILSLWTGWGATLLTVSSALFILSHSYKSRLWRLFEGFLAPLLAIPHAAFAIALLFLLAPSGWIIRGLSPWLTGFDYPPDWLTTQDPYGLTLILALWLKELPYILFVMLAALKQIPWRESLTLGQSLGYSESQIWWRLIFVPLLRALRLPILAVLAFSLSVVDVAQVIGPGQPSTLAVMIWQWFNQADFEYWAMASQGCFWLLLLVLMSLAVAYFTLLAAEMALVRSAMNGQRRLVENSKALGSATLYVILVFYMAAFCAMLLWSFSHVWRFPGFLPNSWSLKYWLAGSASLWPAISTSLALAFVSAAISLILAVGCLEYECIKRRRQPSWIDPSQRWLLYLPLLMPQIAFLFGAQLQWLQLGLDATFIGLVWAHTVFVLPYVFITIADTYNQFDDRYLQQSQSLGHHPMWGLLRIKWPMLSAILALGFSVGFAVSNAQYLPTLFIGGGRWPTLTTEAVALASGGDRRLTSVVVLWQSLLPMLVYGAALLWPKWRYRHRQGMQG